MLKLLSWVRLPQADRIQDLDDPSATLVHAEIIRQKPILRKIYVDFYRRLKKCVGSVEGGKIVELGSGAGFIKSEFEEIITSDVIELDNVDMIFSAMDMPFECDSVDAFVMIDVLHHISDPRLFFKEIIRCLRPGGKVVMVEPAGTAWARFIYKNFHHEPFDTRSSWHFDSTGPLSNANGAIPWIIFTRDREIFEKEFPSLKVRLMCNHSPFRYLVSGGFTLRQLMPSFLFPVVRFIEFVLSPLNNVLGMFQTIELQKDTV